MALFACAGEGDSYQGLHRAECGVGCVFRLGKLICVVGEQRRCAGFNALVHGHGVGCFGNHADMPSRVPEAQPLVSDEADESEAFASLALALGKKIDCEGARFGRLLLWRGKALGRRLTKGWDRVPEKGMPLR